MNDEWIAIIRNRYIEFYEKLIGEKFKPEELTGQETVRRIEKALTQLYLRYIASFFICFARIQPAGFF